MAQKTVKLLQAALIPFRITDGTLEVMLITSRNTGRWVLPKGGIERKETPLKAAMREAEEEAGVTGNPWPERIGVYSYRKTDMKGGGDCHVQVYAMAVTAEAKDWPEKNVRSRQWFKCDDAAVRVNEPELRDLLVSFLHLMTRRGLVAA
ncbi:MAG: NUDIX hydrolase [Rhodospirillales bacterium]